MRVEVLPTNDQLVLNYSSKIITTIENNIQSTKNDPAFPIVIPFFSDRLKYNEVTFIYFSNDLTDNQDNAIFVVGNFDHLYASFQLKPVYFLNEKTEFYAITLKLPVARFFRYRLKKDNTFFNDPLNPLTITTDNGSEWSAFHTESYKAPLCFEEWEQKLLKRFISFILPLHTDEFKTFIKSHSGKFDNETKSLVSRLDYDLGVTNFIDKLLARYEPHHLIRYKKCLVEMQRLLLEKNKTQEPEHMDDNCYEWLYETMKTPNSEHWRLKEINSVDFLKTFRRHIITGALSHPRHGGNTNAIGWNFLESILSDNKGNTYFNWHRALEKPLGNNEDYIA